ncbi:MAG: hypothetical protein IKI15_04575 [Lachnospiraceae bacterium]|nr:hypothetical protein [Lachnospiraceae bacterium]
MGFKDFYNDSVNKDKQAQSWADQMAPVRAIYGALPVEYLQSEYRDSLPRPEKDFFKEVVEVIGDHAWVRCKEAYDQSSLSLYVHTHYDKEAPTRVVGGNVMVRLSDPIRQLRWPDGTLHLYAKDNYFYYCEIPKAKVGFFDSFRSEQKRFPGEQKRILGESLAKASELIKFTAGSQEYVDLKFYMYGDDYHVTIFRDGNAYCKDGPSKQGFKEGLAEAIKQLNRK